VIQVPTVPIGQTITLDFVTHRGDTGAITDADSTPTSEVFEDANDTAILTPTVTKRASKTGNYRLQVACTVANGFELGKSYNVVASATVNTVAGKAVVATFVCGPAFFTGTVVSNGSNTSSTFKTDRAESTTDNWKRAILIFYSGALAGQAQKVSAYNGSTNFVTLQNAFSGAPSAGDMFVLLPIAEDLVADVQSGLATSSAVSAIDGRVPSALVGGKMDSAVGAFQTDATTGQNGTVAHDVTNSATVFKTSLTSTVTDQYKDMLCRFRSGASIGAQVKKVTGYDGSTKRITVSGGFTSTPADNDAFDLVSE
jgi:hypothetical protein